MKRVRKYLLAASLPLAAIFVSCGHGLLPANGADQSGGTGPVVTSVSPTSGGPGTVVFIVGANFFSNTTVTVGGQPCQETFVPSATQIQCTIPAGLRGPLDIIVANPDGQLTTVAG